MKFIARDQKNFPTNKTDLYHIDDIWSLDILDLKDYGLENNKGYRYVLVVIDNFSKYGWTVPLKNKNAQTITNTFGYNLITAERKPIYSKMIKVTNFTITLIKII